MIRRPPRSTLLEGRRQRQMCIRDRDRFVTQNRPNITKFSKELFYTLKPLHKVSETYINELLTASKLTDIGRKIGFYSKHLNANFIILNALNYGYTHKEKALIATIIKQNGKKSMSQIEYEELKELLPDENSVIWLSFILKLATVLDLSLIHISEPTRLHKVSRMPSSA